MSAYENTRICLRCGTFYLGNPCPEADTNLSSTQGFYSNMVMLGFFILLLLVGSVTTILLRGSASGTEANSTVHSQHLQHP